MKLTKTISHVVIDGANYIGNEYVDNSKNVKCKSIIVRFTTFRHQTRFYGAKKKFTKGVKVKLDLTKTHRNLLAEVNKYCNGSNIIKILLRRC